MSMRRNLFVSVCALICMSALAVQAAADEKKPRNAGKAPDNADPEHVKKADPDFSDQGEYTGTGAGGAKMGAHVKALGKGKFDVYLYEGGLPGDGFDPKKGGRTGPLRVERSAAGIVGKGKDGAKVVIAKGKLQVVGADGNETAAMRRVERVSPTMGQKAPKGAVVLFDGTSADGWQHESKRFTEEGFLLRGTRSKKQFQSCKIHLEFRTPWEPTRGGQGRGNSGVYVQQRYEVQVLDSFGVQKHGTGDCGGMYSIAPADVNMCYPPLRWQTYDIEFTAAEFAPAEAGQKPKRVKDATMTVWHNGVLIHDKRKIDKPRTTASPKTEGPNPESIFLQDHGHWVVYRNIWVVEK